MIRPANEADGPALAGLWTEAYVTGEPGGRTEPYTEADYRDSAAGGWVFVAEAGGEVDAGGRRVVYVRRLD